jgi:hypothetical protein
MQRKTKYPQFNCLTIQMHPGYLISASESQVLQEIIHVSGTISVFKYKEKISYSEGVI